MGTAQFGQKYGIANQGARVSTEEGSRILEEAWASGLNTLDTAIAYGDSEERLGQIGVRNWRVVTKLPGIPEECSDVSRWVQESVGASLKRLKIPRLHGLLLHRPRELLGPQGESLYAALVALKQSGETAAIGVSIYGPDELDLYWQRFTFDLVQAPFNVIDRRLLSSGWLARLRKAGVEVHTRSVFLQGLLLMTPANRPKIFEPWQPLWDQWDFWLRSEQLTALEACLSFAQTTPGIDRVIVGVDTRSQLREILSAAGKTAATVPASLASNDQHLINPGNWNAP